MPNDTSRNDRGRNGTEEEEKFLRSKFFADIAFMMRSPQGRRVVCELLKDTKVTESVYNENPNLMYFLEGNRNVGLMLLADVMEACPAESFDVEGR